MSPDRAQEKMQRRTWSPAASRVGQHDRLLSSVRLGLGANGSLATISAGSLLKTEQKTKCGRVVHTTKCGWMRMAEVRSGFASEQNPTGLWPYGRLVPGYSTSATTLIGLPPATLEKSLLMLLVPCRLNCMATTMVYFGRTARDSNGRVPGKLDQ